MLELILGPMFANKTTDLLRRIRRHKLSEKKILIVGNSLDTRSGQFICTHDGIKEPIIMVERLEYIFDDEKYKECDIIAFDEMQFFEDLVESVRIMLLDGKHIICSGLSGTYKQTPFENVSQLISLATDVTFLKAICVYKDSNGKVCGNDAPFTIKITGIHENNEKDIEVGGLELYCPRCLKHSGLFIPN